MGIRQYSQFMILSKNKKLKLKLLCTVSISKYMLLFVYFFVCLFVLLFCLFVCFLCFFCFFLFFCLFFFVVFFSLKKYVC